MVPVQSSQSYSLSGFLVLKVWIPVQPCCLVGRTLQVAGRPPKLPRFPIFWLPYAGGCLHLRPADGNTQAVNRICPTPILGPHGRVSAPKPSSPAGRVQFQMLAPLGLLVLPRITAKWGESKSQGLGLRPTGLQKPDLQVATAVLSSPHNHITNRNIAEMDSRAKYEAMKRQLKKKPI